MAYTPKTWVCGETITADGLNNIEDGVQEALECCDAGGNIIFQITESGRPCPNDPDHQILVLTYSHSWQEIYDALVAGKKVVKVDVYDNGPDDLYVEQALITQATAYNGEYKAYFSGGSDISFSDATSKEVTDDSDCVTK